MAGALLALFGMLLARERYCAWYYRDIYARETLNRYGFPRREELLRYALFRNALLKRGLDAADIQELARIAEIAGPPLRNAGSPRIWSSSCWFRRSSACRRTSSS